MKNNKNMLKFSLLFFVIEKMLVLRNNDEVYHMQQNERKLDIIKSMLAAIGFNNVKENRTSFNSHTVSKIEISFLL